MQSLLESSGYEITIAGDYSQIFNNMDHHTYDLILVEMLLYPESGLDVVGVIKAKFNGSTPKKIYIMADVCCYEELKDRWDSLNELAKSRGAAAVIRRPETINDFQLLCA